MCMHAACMYAAAKSLQSCPTLCDPTDGSPPGSPIHGISPGENTGVGCHFLLQCMKVKRESEVAQSCLTLRDPMDCSPPGSSLHGIFQARVLEWGAIAFSGCTYICLYICCPDAALVFFSISCALAASFLSILIACVLDLRTQPID